MSKRMLVDASHPEEIRLVVCNKGLIEDFEYQSSLRNSLKGNVYLAKVSKVEPSLQAAFIEYGGGRQGFLPFAEIHPDYYQIPAADKEKLLQQMIDDAKKESELEDAVYDKQTSSDLDQEQSEDSEAGIIEPQVYEKQSNKQSKKSNYWQKYKIQEVIKKDQVILVQVEKDERGVKGVTLTTYISLAGRYCVLMPNSTNTGGISRKVADNKEKKRMKDIVSELIADKPSTSLILRTAGAYKSKVEIKRDFTYLSKLWDNIRSHTLASKAPTFIHDESNMMKYAIRDLYTNDIEEIVVSGNAAYNEIHSAMEMFMPKHLNRVMEYTSQNPIFIEYNVESQIASLYSPSVQLPSGGYIVINQTEALVSIDVNSGKSNKERNIENTALNTNIEAATEIARQLRLRDLSGLIVIDFIDMADYKHKKLVESALSDAILKDRARIQIGKISMFGLLQMSRQRMNQSFIEANTSICPHCEGRGRVRPVTASAIAVLRAIASEIAGHNFEELHVSVSADLLIYISNHKRKELLELEATANGRILFFVDEEAGADGFFMKQIKGVKKKVQPTALSSKDLPSYNNIDELLDDGEIIPQPSNSHEKRKGRNSNKKNWRNAKTNNNESGIEESSLNISHESDLASNSNERKKGRKNKRKGKFNKKDSQPYEAQDNHNVQRDEYNSNKTDGIKSEQNQSLLREIWKKFVD